MASLFLCGDVMTGRGVDQLFAEPGARELREDWIRDAREYVELAESVGGAIPRGVTPEYVWGDALTELNRARPDVRLINLETSITASGDFWPDKGIHYRMHPRNIGCLSAARIDACALANNHVMDFGTRGLRETLTALRKAGIACCGAGADLDEAQRPASVAFGRAALRIFSMGIDSSGIPEEWMAAKATPGVWRLPDLSAASAAGVLECVAQARRPHDRVVVSIHWGTNWGYDVPEAHVRFAHQLIDGGVDVIHGHSSHHPRPVEVYRGKLILYGCGDFIDDYEGIRGHEIFRPRLRAMYFATLDELTGALGQLRLVPLVSEWLSLRHAPASDRAWLAETLTSESSAFGTRFEARGDDVLLAQVARGVSPGR